eukprot:10322121-Alexandrium_andersonii.AAC.1
MRARFCAAARAERGGGSDNVGQQWKYQQRNSKIPLFVAPIVDLKFRHPRSTTDSRTAFGESLSRPFLGLRSSSFERLTQLCTFGDSSSECWLCGASR